MADESREIWEANAAFWDDYIGPEGNEFHRELVAPAQLRLLDVRPGHRVLDIACGNGQFSRELASLGASVLAFDFSETFIARAEGHTDDTKVSGIEYQVLDATDEQALRQLGDHEFDAAVCTMALMDIPDIDPLLRTLPNLLKPGGCFVFSVQHPCFNSTGAKMVTSENAEGAKQRSVTVTNYLDIPPELGVGISGQPVPHLYFHRSVSTLFASCFRHGFIVDGLEEPAYSEVHESSDRLRWRNYKQIPPVLVVRVRAPHE